jgi:hypothetical protein
MWYPQGGDRPCVLGFTISGGNATVKRLITAADFTDFQFEDLDGLLRGEA